MSALNVRLHQIGIHNPRMFLIAQAAAGHLAFPAPDWPDPHPNSTSGRKRAARKGGNAQLYPSLSQPGAGSGHETRT